MPSARQIITLALEGIGVIGESETLSASTLDYAFRELNAIVDKFGAGRIFLFQDIFVSGTVTGTTLTTGTGSFLAVSVGQEIQGMLADNYSMSEITIEEYRDIFNKNVTGLPKNYAYDGFNKIYLYPAATNNTMTIQCRSDLQTFADYDTNYNLPAGYQDLFIASLQVIASYTYAGKVPQDLYKKEFIAKQAIGNANIRPEIIDADNLTVTSKNILNGFN